MVQLGAADHQQVCRFLLKLSVQVCVKIMPKGKEISSGLREAIVAAGQSGTDNKTISKQFELQCPAMRRFTYKCKAFRMVTSITRSNCPPNLPQDKTMQYSEKCKKKYSI